MYTVLTRNSPKTATHYWHGHSGIATYCLKQNLFTIISSGQLLNNFRIVKTAKLYLYIEQSLITVTAVFILG